jgi:GGDEF domain-containing protein
MVTARRHAREQSKVNPEFEATSVQGNDEPTTAEPSRPGWFRAMLGALAGKRSPRMAAEGSDSSTLLYNLNGLMAQGNILLASCRGERRELTLAVFDCDDLLEARQVYGNRTGRKLTDCIVRKMTLLAGDRGLAGRTGPTQFSVVLPMGRDRALQAIERVLGNPGRIELEGGNSEIVLVPDVMVETVPDTASLERLFAALCRGLARLREQEQLRHKYLQRERQRHSRPVPVQADPAPPLATVSRTPLLDPDPVITHQLPNTIPMPLPTA